MICLVAMLMVLTQQDQASNELDHVILNAYEANRLQLSRQGEIGFERSQGTATDEDSAMNGVWNNKVTGHGIYAFKDKSIRYDLLFNIKNIDASSEKKDFRTITTNLNSFRLLSNGGITLFDDKLGSLGKNVAGTAQIHEGINHVKVHISMPLDVGLYEEKRWRLGPLLTNALRGDSTTQIIDRKPNESIDGRNVYYVVFNYSDARLHYWIDLERGALPLRYREVAKNGRTTLAIKWSDIRKVGTSAWFPFRETSFLSGKTARQTLITYANFDNAPDPSLFQLEFDKPVSIINELDKVRYAPQRTWNLSNLPDLNSPLAKKIDLSPPMPVPTIAPQRVGTTAFYALIAGAVLLFLGGGIAVWRSQSGKA